MKFGWVGLRANQDPNGFRQYVHARRCMYMESPLSQASVTYSEASPSKVHAFFDNFEDDDDSGSTTPDEEDNDDDGYDDDEYDDFVDPRAQEALLARRAQFQCDCISAERSLVDAITKCEITDSSHPIRD